MFVMSVELLTERYSKQISGMLSCYDQILIFGTLPNICFAEGMSAWLYKSQVRIFDYPRFAEPFRDQLPENAEKLAIRRCPVHGNIGFACRLLYP